MRARKLVGLTEAVGVGSMEHEADAVRDTTECTLGGKNGLDFYEG